MKTFASILLFALVLVPAATAAQATNVTGDWNATFTATRADGSTSSAKFTFHLAQKGKTLTGTIGPSPERQWKIDKGVVDGAKVTFQVQQPDGPLRSYALELVKGRLLGTLKLELNGQTGEAKVDAERAKAK
jgi:opacity protein-like surface antigen